MVAKGIHPGLGMEEYHSWKLDKSNLLEGPISCSMLKDFDANPYAWLKSPDRKQTKAMAKGSIFDAALTDPDSLESLVPFVPEIEPFQILPFENRRTKAAKEWIAENEGIRIVTESEAAKEKEDYDEAVIKRDATLEDANNAAKAVWSHPVAGKILEGAQFQVGVVGEVGNIPAKCLLDILPHEDSEWCETIFDYKTTSFGLEDEGIRKAIGKFKYHWQSAFYRTNFNKVSPDRLCEDFGFIFQDSTTHEVRVVILSSDALALGTRAVGEALKEFARCAHKGIASRYRNSVNSVDLMPYDAMNEEERLERRDQ